MGFKCGFVGLPNVGKSTIFNALTSNEAPAENYPFCTIDPNVGIVQIPDERMDKLNEAYNTQKIIPAVMEFVDIAGIVKGASKGEGLGNQFLTNIRECDALLHVVRCFDDTDVVHVDGSVDPVRDAEVIETELILKDLESIEKRITKEQKLARGGDKVAKAIVSALEKIQPALEDGKLAKTIELTEDEEEAMNSVSLLTSKPLFYCANILEDDIGSENKYVTQLREYAQKQQSEVVAICGKIESELATMEPEDKKEFLTDLGLEESGLDQVIHKGFALLGLKTYFTAGEKEIRAWTYHDGDKAPACAGVIHTDFEKGFIRAETLSYSDFEKYGTWNAAKENGDLRVEGKEYVVQDGDIMHFLFNV